MFIWIIFIVVLIYMFRNEDFTSRKTPLERLNERLAAGEITIEEYKKIKKEL